MSNKKKDLAKKLIDLKLDESGDTALGAEALDLSLNLDLSEIELDSKSQTAVAIEDSKDQTIRLVHTSAGAESDKNGAFDKSSSDKESSQVQVSYGLPLNQQVPKSDSFDVSSSEPKLQQSEHLRIAQNKINELEDQIIKLRRENEDLASAAETFKKLNDEYFVTISGLKSKVGDQKQTFSQEVELLKKINSNKDKKISEYKQQIDEYKSRIDNNFQRVRKREKDLEHRLEIAKIEEAAVVKSKDQLILDLKRRIDDLSLESDNFRKKSQENYKELEKKQQVVRGVTRALRIALTKLEGDDDSEYGLGLESDSEND